MRENPRMSTIAAREVAILGSTGSIGTQALDVIARSEGRLVVRALAAGARSPDLLAEQVARTGADIVGVSTPAAANRMLARLDALGCRRPRTLEVGEEAAAAVAARGVPIVLNALAGAAGLTATAATLRAGSTLALANKESLVIGGPLVTALAAPGQIIPVDSEHSALAQCLRSGRLSEVSRLILTASGGPFRNLTRFQLRAVTPEQALEHPTWSMGPLVTVNSATLFNKGLELIEAHLLFGIPLEQIEVVVHPQSIVHSMVEFCDGSTLAQASPPDMRLPIAVALAWPERMPGVIPGMDWSRPSQWTFVPLDGSLFPAVDLARRAARHSGAAPAVCNAANEVAVATFLAGGCAFTDIIDLVGAVLGDYLADPLAQRPCTTIEDLIACDAWARGRARSRLGPAARG